MCVTANLRTRNVAAVIVTADLAPFAARGTRMDVTVSSLGDASSLMGGTLAVDLAERGGRAGLRHFAGRRGGHRLYRAGTGGDADAGRADGGTRAQWRDCRTRNIQPACRTTGLCRSSCAIPISRRPCGSPMRSTAMPGAHYRRRGAAHEESRNAVTLCKPPGVGAPHFVAEIGELLVEPDTPARVVVDARTGTVVIGQDVQISPVAVTHGSLTVRVTETPQVSQPAPFSDGPHGRDAADRDRRRGKRRPDRHAQGTQPQATRHRPQPHRPQAAGHHRHFAGDQGRGRSAGRPRDPIISHRAANPKFASDESEMMVRETRALPEGGVSPPNDCFSGDPHLPAITRSPRFAIREVLVREARPLRRGGASRQGEGARRPPARHKLSPSGSPASAAGTARVSP